MADPWAQFVQPDAQAAAPNADPWAQYAAPAPAPAAPSGPAPAPATLQEGTYKLANGAISDFPDQAPPQPAPAPSAPDNRSAVQKIKDLLTHDFAPDIKAAWNSPGSMIGTAANNAGNALAQDVAPLTGKVDLNDPQAVAGNAGNMAKLSMALTGLMPGTANAAATSIGGRGVAPTADELFTAGGKQLSDAAASGVEFAPSHVAGLASDIKQGISTGGNTLSSAVAPQTHNLLDDLANPPAGAVGVPIGQLHNATSKLGALSRSAAGTPDGAAASMARQGLLGFLQDAPPQSIVAGATEYPAAKQLIAEGMGNWGAGIRAGTLTGKVENAELRAGSVNSGNNTGNSVRQRFTDLVQNPPSDPTAPSIAARSGYNPDEIAAIKGVSQGTLPLNLTRSLANRLGGGGGLAGTIIGTGGGGVLGAHLLGPEMGPEIGAMVGAGVTHSAGALAKALENRTVTNAARGVADQVAQRSPLYQSGALGTAGVFPTAQNALVKALIAQQGQSGTASP